MALKPRHKRRFFWGAICTIATIALAVVIIPPMITLNKLKPVVEKSIYEQTNVPIKLDGDIHFSLIGGATIVAHDVTIPTAKIASVLFSIPFRGFFNIENSKLTGPVIIYDAEITIDKLSPAAFNHNIEIYNSKINFMGRKFHIVRADFTDNEFHGIIRTPEHKYEVEFSGDNFHIKNKNSNLDITGKMFSDGSINGHISLETDNINEWFGFKTPKIEQKIKLSMNFEWNGGDGYRFTNIVSDHFSGNITFYPNGEKTIQLVSDNLDYDFTFLLNPDELIHNTKLNLNFYGDLRFQGKNFNHLLIDATGTQDTLQISKIIIGDTQISGGLITKNGAKNIKITLPIDNKTAKCLFSGTPKNWTCSKFVYDNLSGSLSVDNDVFFINVTSKTKMPTDEKLLSLARKLGKSGTIKFSFADISGTYQITSTDIIPTYNYAKNKTLKWLNINIPFLPEFMKTASGDFSWNNGMLTFTPYDKQWQLSTYDNYFYISGTSFKSWLPSDLDTRFLQDSSYTISGFFDGNKISNMNLNIAGHEFSGSASGKNLTLNTETFNIEPFINPQYTNNSEQMEFLSNLPILTLFNLPFNISLSSGALIYKNSKYNNFLYTLKPESQTFSITDLTRGNLLTTIERNKTNYTIFTQLNRFVINGPLLSSNMPLNIRDTMITGQITMKTNGQIAHDIYYNMSGNLDLSFSDGYIVGFGFDDFYASAENITILNSEFALSRALKGGQSRIKKMRLVGTYSNGNFISTEAIDLSTRHTDIIGGLAITDGLMTGEFDIIMRGTAPSPSTINLGVLPDGTRKYSLSEIMQNLDPHYMRAFIKTHDKF